jgi:hypothetical protein
MNFLPGLRRFGFCGLQVAVLLHSVAGPVFPALSRFNKNDRKPFPTSGGWFCFVFLRLGLLADSNCI